MTAGSAAGLVCGLVALSLVTVGVVLLAGAWGLLAAAVLWAGCSVLLVNIGDLYARNS